MIDHELSNVVEQHSMQEDGCENAKEAEMETELTKVDLAEVKSQQATASMPDSNATSSDQGTRISHGDPAAVIVHVPVDGNDEPGDRSLSTQYASVAAEEQIKSNPLQSTASFGKQTPDDVEMEKIQELCLISLDEDEKDVGKDAQQPKQVLDEDEKQQLENVKSDELMRMLYQIQACLCKQPCLTGIKSSSMHNKYTHSM